MKNTQFLSIAFLVFVVLFAGSCSRTGNASLKRATAAEVPTGPADILIAESKKDVNRNPNSAKAHLKLASAYLAKVRETGQYSLNRLAEQSIRTADGIDPSNFDALVLRSQILLSEHKFESALRLSESMEKERPGNPVALAVKTDALTEMGRYDEAVTAAQAFVDTRPGAASFSRVAQLRFLHGDTEGALEARRQAIRMSDPMSVETHAWYWSQYGKDLYETGRFDDAEKAFENSLQILGDYHWALAGKGKVEAAKGNLEKAARVYEKLKNQSPTVERTIYLADIKLKMGLKREADKLYKDAAETAAGEENPDLHRIALLWGDHDQNLEKALEIARNDRKTNNDLASSDTFAWLLYKNGDFKEAKAQIADAMRLGSKNALFYYHSGMIEKALGNKVGAKRLLELALATNPSFDLFQVIALKEALCELGTKTSCSTSSV